MAEQENVESQKRLARRFGAASFRDSSASCRKVFRSRIRCSSKIWPWADGLRGNKRGAEGRYRLGFRARVRAIWAAREWCTARPGRGQCFRALSIKSHYSRPG